ncbi:hypothetical protein [Microvirga antarctica]|uniref:hypothetical protein n=1 Tax=Microvirga antarctica TaxID=2819233 RepID=UPI001B300462|nr:hypothetical protein [Microvirga antarctica]
MARAIVLADDAAWRADIDSLAFRPRGHLGLCVIHRLAFRALLAGDADPSACLGYFVLHRDAFERAASLKAERKILAPGANFHLTSRDIRRAGMILA